MSRRRDNRQTLFPTSQRIGSTFMDPKIIITSGLTNATFAGKSVATDRSCKQKSESAEQTGVKDTLETSDREADGRMPNGTQNDINRGSVRHDSDDQTSRLLDLEG